MSLSSDMQKQEDDKAYKAGVKSGQEGGWFSDLVHTGTSPVAFGRHAEIFQKGYEWGAAHRHSSKSDSSSDDTNSSPTSSDSGYSYDSSMDSTSIASKGNSVFGRVFAVVYWGVIAFIWIWYFKLWVFSQSSG